MLPCWKRENAKIVGEKTKTTKTTTTNKKLRLGLQLPGVDSALSFDFDTISTKMHHSESRERVREKIFNHGSTLKSKITCTYLPQKPYKICC